MTDRSAWVKLERVRCPVNGCPNTELINWQCSSHQTPRYVNAMGQTKCDACVIVRISDFYWCCGHSFHNGQYHKADLEGLTLALSRSPEFTAKHGAQWVASLVHNLTQQYNNMNAQESCATM
ncbi:uncharacterized protein LOC127844897 [Dreissena polymorpha]|uniref:Uncharacterized protein n=1 Tax=Dreissena polymorpha TaxID=45954 RepID=A0A9D4E607_DREPO|nr:uncharacterized protein LOC127844897 [Dreissena polymorpha]KAH3773821.1 hypothetical protein DPMN_175191 [Dreissena polymorpha]